jgi:hypothetical protein
MTARWAPFIHREELVVMTTGHVVTRPNGGRHLDLRLTTGVELLLAATIASVRIGHRVLVYEPPSTLAACARCEDAYVAARKVIEDAGGLESWMARFTP